jgi:hypothetical protein
VNDLINPVRNPDRIDSFYYNANKQITLIKSVDFRGLYSYKKTFNYDASGKKISSLKYTINSDSLYVLSDSTVYQYQDSTIFKFTYHPAIGTIDTSFFTYNQQMNIVTFKIGLFGTKTVEELGRYDTELNPYSFTNTSGIELDPYPSRSWQYDFALAMQSPKFSRNNYTRSTANPEPFNTYEIGYSALDSIVVGTSSTLPGDVSFFQSFEYTVAK